MKKIQSLTLILLIACVLSCKKQEDDPIPEPAPTTPAADVTPPVITLNGRQVDTCYLGTTYTDPGAVAVDNIDGTISPSILVTGIVNSSLAGTYTLNYNVKDAAGNQAIQVSRTVKVLNSAAYLAGTYAVVCTYTVDESSGTPTITTHNYVANVQVSATANNSFTISTLKTGPASVIPITTITGNAIDVLYQNTLYPYASASGTLSSSRTFFTINSFSNDQMYVARTHACKNVYTRQ